MHDVAVVGGGLMGLLSAYELALAGASVVLLERRTLGSEASSAGAGILYPLYPWGIAEALFLQCLRSERLYPALVESLYNHTGIFCDYRRSGLAILDGLSTSMASQWIARQPGAQMMGSHFLPLPAADDPILFLPDVEQVSSSKLLRALKARVLTLGVEVCEYTPVTALLVENNTISGVVSRADTYLANQVVLAAGAFSQRLLQSVKITAPLYAAKGQMLLLSHPHAGRIPMILKNNCYLVPRANDNTILVGSTYEREFSTQLPTLEGYQTLHRFACQLWPELLRAEVLAQWCGLRPARVGGMPWVGAIPEIEGLYINTGHDRLGVTLAPLAAKSLVASMRTMV